MLYLGIWFLVSGVHVFVVLIWRLRGAGIEVFGLIDFRLSNHFFC